MRGTMTNAHPLWGECERVHMRRTVESKYCEHERGSIMSAHVGSTQAVNVCRNIYSYN